MADRAEVRRKLREKIAEKRGARGGAPRPAAPPDATTALLSLGMDDAGLLSRTMAGGDARRVLREVMALAPPRDEEDEEEAPPPG